MTVWPLEKVVETLLGVEKNYVANIFDNQARQRTPMLLSKREQMHMAACHTVIVSAT